MSRLDTAVALVLVGLPAYGLAVLIDALGDVVKDDSRIIWQYDGWIDMATHSRPERVFVVLVCLGIMLALLWLAERLNKWSGMKYVERIALLAGLLTAPMLGLNEWIASRLETVLL